MKKRTKHAGKLTDLRIRAEEVSHKFNVTPHKMTSEDSRDIIEELRIHQIELEMQNEELRNAQQELEESRSKYSELYNFAPVGYFTFDAHGVITEVNLTGAKMLGVKRSKLVRTPFSLYITPESKELYHKYLSDILKFPKRLTIEIKIIRKNNESFYAQVESKAALDNDGKLTQFRTVITDITEHKQAEEWLQENEQRYRQLFTHSPVSLWEEDASKLNPYFDRLRKTGVKKFKAYFESHPEAVQYCTSLIKVIDVNDASVRMFKAEHKEDFFKGLDKIFTEKSYEAFKQVLIAIAEGKIYFEIEGIQKTFTGEEIYVMLCFSVVPGYEKTLSKVFVSILDITHRKKAEDALSNYKDELRYLSSKLVLTEERERRRIASAIHDNIGQTLAVSKIKLEMLKKSLVSPQYIEYINDILIFIDQTLNNTRSLIFDLSPRILYELGFEAAVDTLIRKIRQEYSIKCYYYDDSKNKPLNENIAIFLYRTIRELTINVIKHSKAKNLKVTIEKENDKIKIFVEDDGIGFDILKFKSSTRNSFGLFNIKEELNYIGGSIQINSEPGLGTKVTIRAPLSNGHDSLT